MSLYLGPFWLGFRPLSLLPNLLPPDHGTMFAARRATTRLSQRTLGARWASSTETKDQYKVVVIGAG